MQTEINKAEVIRAIETLKARAEEVTPVNLAFELGLPRAMVYSKLDILEVILSSAENLQGADKVIEELLKENKSLKRKNKKLNKEIGEIQKNIETSYNDGFLKGASIKYDEAKEIKKTKSQESVTTTDTELWARGVLMIEPDEKIDLERIKKAYRLLASIIHPDSSAKNTQEQITTLKRAYDLLKLFLT